MSFSAIWSSQPISPESWPTILLSLLMAFAVGVFIAWIYRRNYRGVMYSNNFSLTLVLMTLITCPVVMCIRESVALSMGMVGALSIVRFRTAVTVVGIALLITVLVRVQARKMNSYLLVIRMGEEAERAANQLVGSIRVQQLKSKTVSSNGIEATYEVRVEKPDALLNKLRSVPGVYDATLVSYTGETA